MEDRAKHHATANQWSTCAERDLRSAKPVSTTRGAATILKKRLLHRWESLYSSVAERQSCKLKVLGSNPSGGWKPAYPRAELGRWSHEHQHATRLARTIKKGIPRGFKIEKHNDSPHMITRCRRNSKHPRRKNAKPTNTHAYNRR